MTYTIRMESSRNFVLVDTRVLVYSDILSRRDLQASHKFYNIADTHQDTHFYSPGYNFIAGFIRKYYSYIFLFHNKLTELKAMCISLMVKRVFSCLKKTFHKYKFKRFLSGVDFLKPILQTRCI